LCTSTTPSASSAAQVAGGAPASARFTPAISSATVTMPSQSPAHGAATSARQPLLDAVAVVLEQREGRRLVGRSGQERDRRERGGACPTRPSPTTGTDAHGNLGVRRTTNCRAAANCRNVAMAATGIARRNPSSSPSGRTDPAHDSDRPGLERTSPTRQVRINPAVSLVDSSETFA
jgi:hypothetical protein